MATRAKQKVAATSSGFSLISATKLKQIYAAMLKCRALGEWVAPLLKQGKSSSTYCGAIGQEATKVGVITNLRSMDTVAPSHCNFTTSLIQGVPLKTILSRLLVPMASPDEIYLPWAVNGNAGLNGAKRPGTMVGELKIATDAALATKKQNRSNIVVVFSGEGSGIGEPWEKALRIAGRQCLPMLFVAQADTLPESGRKIQRLVAPRRSAKPIDVPRIPVCGNDVVAVYRVAFEAIARARQGGGPTLLECKSDASYVDPIVLMEKYLAGKNLFTPKWRQRIVQDFALELQKAAKFASPWPGSG